MKLSGIVLRNLLFHRKKTLPVVLLCGLFLLLPAASWLLVRQITTLADRPLATLNTELILQQDSKGKDADAVRTRGLVEPFNLHHFDRQNTSGKLTAIKGIDRYSTALVLWQFDPQNTLTVVGLDPADPPMGLRKIENLLMKGGRFFSDSGADEVILERHFAKLFGHKPGGRFQLAGRELAIVGLIDFTEQSNLSNAAVFLPYDTALRLSGLEERVINQVFVALAGMTDVRLISDDLARAFPGFSLISRDSLYKNLSAFNRLIYQGGHLFVLLLLPLSLLLLFWVLKMHRLEFAGQTEVLKILGWPGKDLRRWQILDLGYLLAGGVLLAGVLSALLHFLALPHLKIAPFLDQGFQL
ncbi:MAG: ABC transporter permease [Thermodesulfobacteriota bacterium]